MEQSPLFVIEKRCVRCHLIKPIDNFYRQSGRPDGHSSWCKVCSSKYGKNRKRIMVLGDSITCIKCGQNKPLTEFNKDKSSRNGYSSYCKECNKQRATEWRRSNGQSIEMPKLTKDEELLSDFYTDAYLEGFQRSNAKSYSAKKKDARLHAGAICPKGSMALKAWGLVGLLRGSPDTKEEWLGYFISRKLLKLNLKRRFASLQLERLPTSKLNIIRNEVTKMNDNGHSTAKSPSHKSMFELYKIWVENNDLIPSDHALSHFGQCGSSAVRSARSRLRSEGFIIDSKGDGWTVVDRPTKEKRIEDLTREEAIALLKKLKL